MKYTIKEFAQKIRNQHPGKYSNVSDTELINKYLKQFPNAREKIDFGSPRSFNIKTAPNTHSSSESNSSYLGWIVLLVLGVLLAITNPDESKHVREASAVFRRSLNKNLNNSDGSLESSLGSMFGGVLIDGLSGYVISRNNYIFFSTTKISIMGKEQVIGFGILGNVFISDKVADEADNLIKKGKETLNENNSISN